MSERLKWNLHKTINSTSVEVLSKSWDSRNDIWWVFVDFTYTNGTKYRVWTGLKRVDVDVGISAQMIDC